MENEHRHRFSLTKEPGGRAMMLCNCGVSIKVLGIEVEQLFEVEEE